MVCGFLLTTLFHTLQAAQISRETLSRHACDVILRAGVDRGASLRRRQRNTSARNQRNKSFALFALRVDANTR